MHWEEHGTEAVNGGEGKLKWGAGQRGYGVGR